MHTWSFCLCRKKYSYDTLTASFGGPFWATLDLSLRLSSPSLECSPTFVHNFNQVPPCFKNFPMSIGRIPKFLAESKGNFMLRTLFRWPFSSLATSSHEIYSLAVWNTEFLKHVLVTSISFLCACHSFLLGDISPVPLKHPFLPFFSRLKMQNVTSSGKFL